jgi:hypothetical protein
MWNEFDEDIDVKSIVFLYELRHACNVLGLEEVARGLRMSPKNVTRLYESSIHGSEDILDFFNISKKEFSKLLIEYEKESTDVEELIEDARIRNDELIVKLKQNRTNYAGIGTNKAKRRLNKLALTNPLAKAVRLALEIEDKNISAKDSYGKYRDKIYNLKTKLIMDLCKLFKEQNWIYGIQDSKIPPVSHIIYFEIPTCEQISWHFTPEKENEFPAYTGKWDEKINSTIGKLEVVTKKLLQTIQ